jgi:predicted GNAT family acetyltransferase
MFRMQACHCWRRPNYWLGETICGSGGSGHRVAAAWREMNSERKWIDMLNNNTERQRYELIDGDDVVGIAEYELDGDRVILTHTEVLPQHEGKGYGSALAKQVLGEVGGQGLKVVPSCEFMAAYIDRHPEYRELLAGNK